MEFYRGIAKDFHLAVSKMEMYGKAHPISKKNIDKIYDSLRKILDSKSSFCISIAEDGVLVVDDVSLKGDAFAGLLSSDIARKDINSLVFNSTLTREDLRYIVEYFVRSNRIEETDRDFVDYLRRGKIRSVAANSVQYKRVVDGMDSDSSGGDSIGLDFDIGLAPTKAQKILDELSEMSSETIEYLADNGVLKTISDVFGDVDMIKGNREVATLDTVVSRHMQKLGVVRGKELCDWYEKLRRKYVKEKSEKKVEPNISRRAGFVEKLDDYAKIISHGTDPSEIRRRLKHFFEATFDKPDIEEAENIYKFLLSTFVRQPSPGFLIAAEVLVSMLFERSEPGVINNFTKNRIAGKSRERNYSFETDFLTTTLVWLTGFYLSRGKLLPALNIARLFDNRRKSRAFPESLINDAKTYFASLCVGFQLDSLVSAMGGRFFEVPMEIKELIKMIDSRCIAERVLDKMGTQDRNYAIRAAEALSVIPQKSALVFAVELRNTHDLLSSNEGQLLTDVQKRKESGAMIALAIIAKDSALPVLSDLIHDPDTDIRFSALEAISYVGTEKATRLLVKFLYHEGKNWQRDILKLLPRIDPKIAVPILVRFFHTRREHWIHIIRVVGKMKGEHSRTFLVDTLYMWNSYTNAMNTYETEEFILALLDSVEKCDFNVEVRRALRLFLSEWHNFDLIRGLKVVFSSKKDLVTEKARKILSTYHEREL